MSSVPQSNEGLASGINNAASHVAQLAGVAVAAGLGTLMSGYQFGLAAAAIASAAAFSMASRSSVASTMPGGRSFAAALRCQSESVWVVQVSLPCPPVSAASFVGAIGSGAGAGNSSPSTGCGE